MPFAAGGSMRRALWAAATVMGCWGAAAAEVTRSVDPHTQLAGWKLVHGNFVAELIQRLPAQTRGFFEARGFTPGVAARIGAFCVMQTIVRNVARTDDAGAFTVRLSQWRVVHSGQEVAVDDKHRWLEDWSGKVVSEAARVAFRWALFPAEQTFAPGDYGWGMTMLAVPPGGTADVMLVWTDDNGRHSGWIRGLVCAQER